MIAVSAVDGDSYVPPSPLPGEPFAVFLARSKAARAMEPKQSVVVPFPVLWAGGQLPAPNIMLRSALFCVSKRGRRSVVNEILPTQRIAGYSVVFTGARLDQFDADIWLTVVAVARDFGCGARVPITLRGLAGRVGIGGSGEDVDRVRASLDRLYKCEVRLDAGPRRWFRGHLISSFQRIEERYEITLDPTLVELFVPDQFTLLMGAERLALDSNLAKWLHGFLATQTAPERFAYKVESLRDLCGSETRDLRSFRQKLRAALADLQGRGIVTAWSIDAEDDLVRITRPGSESQKRALKKSDARANRARLAAIQNAGPRGGRGGNLQRLF